MRVYIGANCRIRLNAVAMRFWPLVPQLPGFGVIVMCTGVCVCVCEASKWRAELPDVARRTQTQTTTTTTRWRRSATERAQAQQTAADRTGTLHTRIYHSDIGVGNCGPMWLGPSLSSKWGPGSRTFVLVYCIADCVTDNFILRHWLILVINIKNAVCPCC